MDTQGPITSRAKKARVGAKAETSSSVFREGGRGSSSGCGPMLRTDWLDSIYGNLGVSSLPGRKLCQRSMDPPVASLSRQHFRELTGTKGVNTMFLFCPREEISRLFQGHDIVAEATSYGIAIHQYRILDTLPPTIDECDIILADLEQCLTDGKTVLCVSRNGYGRAPTVLAAYLMKTRADMLPDQALEAVRTVRGRVAVQTVKQYNFLHEYYEHLHGKKVDADDSRNRDSKGLDGLLGSSPQQRTKIYSSKRTSTVLP
eukprot:Stramenopile-MAST_4_protein_2321